MNLDPARSASHILAVVLCPPALHEAHPNGAHLGELVDSLEALVDGLGEKLGELLVVEDLQTAARRDLADRGWVEPVGVVALTTLDEDGSIAQTLCEHLSTDIEQVHPLADVAADVFDGRVPVDVREQPETEPIGIRGGICVAIHDHVGSSSMEALANPLVQFVVGDGAPVGRLLVLHLHRHNLGHWQRRHNGRVVHTRCRPKIS